MPERYLETLAVAVVMLPLAATGMVFWFRRHLWRMGVSTIFFSLLSLLASIYLAQHTIGLSPIRFTFLYVFDNYLDDLSIYFILLVNLVALFASLYALPFMEYSARHQPLEHDPVYFHVFFNLFHFTMLAVLVVDNLVLLWIAVELTTVVSTLLVRYRRDRRALEAAWKCIMVTTTGIIFALLGTLFLANALPSEVTSMNWSVLARPETAKTLDQQLVKMAFLFILIGYGAKAGLAPLHTWLPDGHGEAPSPVSAMLSGVMLKTAFFAILRFYTITNLNLNAGREGSHPFTSTALLLAGLFSLTVAVPLILKPNRFKRVLAYHSLEHMGIIAFGVGLGVPAALVGALLHTLNHALTKALMFLSFGYIQQVYIESVPADMLDLDEESHLRGVWHSMTITGAILMGGGLALVGSPPFNIFMSEFIILWAAIQKAVGTPSVSDHWLGWAVAVFVLTLTFIFGGLVVHLSRILLGESPFAVPQLQKRLPLLGIGLMLFIILLFGLVIPSWPVNYPALLQGSVNILLRGAP